MELNRWHPGLQIPVERKAVKSAEIHDSCAGYWFHHWWNLLSLSAELVSEPQSFFMTAINRPFFSSVFVGISIYLSFSSLGGVEPKRGLSVLPQRLQKLVAYHSFLFLVRRTLPTWEIPFWC